MPLIQEIKRHKNKLTQRFACERLHLEAGHAVLRYRSDTPGQIADIQIEAGATTIAHYWEGRGYVLWRMFDASGQLIGTLFHICRDVQISQTSVSYLDLILETRDRRHLERILAELGEAGYAVRILDPDAAA